MLLPFVQTKVQLTTLIGCLYTWLKNPLVKAPSKTPRYYKEEAGKNIFRPDSVCMKWRTGIVTDWKCPISEFIAKKTLLSENRMTTNNLTSCHIYQPMWGWNPAQDNRFTLISLGFLLFISLTVAIFTRKLSAAVCFAEVTRGHVIMLPYGVRAKLRWKYLTCEWCELKFVTKAAAVLGDDPIGCIFPTRIWYLSSLLLHN